MNVLKGMAGIAAAAVISVFAQTENAALPVVSAEKAGIAQGEVPRRYAGFVEAVESTDIMPRVTGTLLKVCFKEGEFVKAGSLLYELEQTTYVAKVESLKAEKQVLEAALKYADNEFQRSDRLLKSNAASVSAHDKALWEIDAAKARIKEIEASLVDAENTLSYTKIYAPISGIIGKNLYSAGNLITPQMGKLTNITSVSPIYVRFSISERVFRQDFGGLKGIRQNTIVKVQLADGTVCKESAKVTLVDNKINASTNTITLWAEFQNKEMELLPGGFVTVQLSSNKIAKHPTVRPSALIAGNGGTYSVYILENGNTVAERKVTLGRTTTEGLQIITGGLKGDELVITDGTHKVTPGAKVTVRNAETKAR